MASSATPGTTLVLRTVASPRPITREQAKLEWQVGTTVSRSSVFFLLSNCLFRKERWLGYLIYPQKIYLMLAPTFVQKLHHHHHQQQQQQQVPFCIPTSCQARLLQRLDSNAEVVKLKEILKKMTEQNVQQGKELMELKELKAKTAESSLLLESRNKAVFEKFTAEKDSLVKELKQTRKQLADRNRDYKAAQEEVQKLKQDLGSEKARSALVQKEMTEFDQFKQRIKDKHQEELRQERASYAQLDQEKRQLELKVKQVRWLDCLQLPR